MKLRELLEVGENLKVKVYSSNEILVADTCNHGNIDEFLDDYEIKFISQGEDFLSIELEESDSCSIDIEEYLTSEMSEYESGKLIELLDFCNFYDLFRSVTLDDIADKLHERFYFDDFEQEKCFNCFSDKTTTILKRIYVEY